MSQKSSQAVDISVVTPVYGCELSLLILHERLTKTLASLTSSYEIIFVNDNSPGNAWQIIQGLAKSDSHVVGINLSRNFGQHYAITAGLDYSRGAAVVVMDCDLQDPPEEIPALVGKLNEGWDIVYGVRHERNDSFIKKTSSYLFYSVFNLLSNVKMDNRIGNFTAVRRNVITEVTKLRERFRTYGALLAWVGFRSTKINVKHNDREHGETTYTFSKALNLGIDLIVMQSDKLLRLSIKLGFFISLLSVCYGLMILIRYYMYEITVPGWTTLAVTLNFLFGAVFVNMGVLGLYLGKTFEEVKRRPLYIVSQTANTEIK